jgi:hypothetical protein
MFYMLAAVGVALAVSMLAVAAGAEQRRRAMIARGATVAAGS